MIETERITTRLPDIEKLRVRIHENMHREGADPTSLLEMVATWIEHEFPGDSVDEETAARFRRRIEQGNPDGCGVDLDKFRAMVLDPATFPHRREHLDSETAARMAALRTRARALLPGQAAGHGGARKQERTTHLNAGAPDTTSRVTRRLNRDRPDLAAQVAAGELSANAAAIEAGFRQRKISVSLDPAAIARAARKHFTIEELAELRQLLDRKEPAS